MCLLKCYSAMDVRSGSTIPAFSRHVTLLPPLACSFRIAYQCITIPSFPSVLTVRFLYGDLSPTALTAPSLGAARPERLPYEVPVSHGTLSWSEAFPPNGGGKTIPSDPCSHISRSSTANSASRFFALFGGGGATPPQCSLLDCPQPAGNPDFSFPDLKA
jgi:hypothetical protein